MVAEMWTTTMQLQQLICLLMTQESVLFVVFCNMKHPSLCIVQTLPQVKRSILNEVGKQHHQFLLAALLQSAMLVTKIFGEIGFQHTKMDSQVLANPRHLVRADLTLPKVRSLLLKTAPSMWQTWKLS